MRNAPKCQDHAQFFQAFDARREKRAAGFYFDGKRFVLRWDTAHGIGDHAAFKLQAVTWRCFIGADGEMIF